MNAIVRCRTAALGGHRDRCCGCGHQAISYNSCRNRHCPKCQGTLVPDGWPRVRPNCCPCPTSTSSSPYRMSYPHSCWGTRSCSVWWSGGVEQHAATQQRSGPLAVGEEAEVADADQAFRQDVDEEASQELVG